MGNCLGCGKKLGIFEGYSDFDGEWCKNCFQNKKEILLKLEKKKEQEKLKEEVKEKKEEKQANPTQERLEQLQATYIATIIFALLGLGLLIFGIKEGYLDSGFFMISIEFIIGLICFFIGLVWAHNISEKIKDLKLVLKEKTKS